MRMLAAPATTRSNTYVPPLPSAFRLEPLACCALVRAASMRALLSPSSRKAHAQAAGSRTWRACRLGLQVIGISLLDIRCIAATTQVVAGPQPRQLMPHTGRGISAGPRHCSSIRKIVRTAKHAIVPAPGFEPGTSALQVLRTTTVLHGQDSRVSAEPKCHIYLVHHNRVKTHALRSRCNSP